MTGDAPSARKSHHDNHLPNTKRSTKREFGRQLHNMTKSPKLKFLLDHPIETWMLPPIIREALLRPIAF
jgi:hypothetical protein